MNSTYYKGFHIYKARMYVGLRSEPTFTNSVMKYIKPGTKLLCINLYVDTSGNTWIKTPFGWCCAINYGEVCIS